jgi:hypothetical protein
MIATRLSPLALLFACGAADDPPIVEQSSECSNHAHNEYVVELTGAAFDAEETTRVYATTNVQLAEPVAGGAVCRITRSAEIASGRFQVTLSNLTDTAVYPFIGVFLDRDGDGMCSPLDPTWGIYGVIVGEPDRIELDPSLFSVDDPREVCSHFAVDP